MPDMTSNPPVAPPSSDSSNSNGRVMARSKTGCMTCRQRRVKCGEERPICSKCIKSKKFCDYGDHETSPDSASGREELHLSSALLPEQPHLYQDAVPRHDSASDHLDLETWGFLTQSQRPLHNRPQSSNASCEGQTHASLARMSDVRRPQPSRFYSEPAPQPCVCQQLRQLLSGSAACNPDRSRYNMMSPPPPPAPPLPPSNSELDWMDYFPAPSRPAHYHSSSTTNTSSAHRHESLTSINPATVSHLEQMFTPQQLQYLQDLGVTLPARNTLGRGHLMPAGDHDPCNWFDDVDLDI